MNFLLVFRFEPTFVIYALITGFIVLAVVLTGSLIYWRRKNNEKEEQFKMTRVMAGIEDNEPLRPSNVKPNLAKLRIVKEAEMRRAGILGYGAFGTVFKVTISS